MTPDEPPARRPAPGGLRLVQEFCNSTDFEGGFDNIATAGGLAEWLITNGYAAEGALTAKDVKRAIAFREALRDTLTVPSAHDLDLRPAVSHLALLRAEAMTLPLRVTIGEHFQLTPVASGLPGAMAAMLGALALGEIDGTARRLKACEAHSCRWVYYDQSRNGSSRWCTMSLCGARSKNRAYRRRLRDAG